MVKDHALNRVFQTEHDLIDRPMGTQLRNEDDSLIYRTELDYDTQNRLVGFGEEVGGDTYKTRYVYDNDNRVTEIGFGDDDKVKYVYDNLGRIASRTAECGADAGKVVSSYTYVAGGHGTGSTTPLVAKITQPKISFEYSYDSRGNIISEKRNGVETTYTYDALGQLIRVNDPHENATWVYNYDRGGNITSKVKYAYTTGALGTAQQTIPYVYGDTNWKDKLTSYNGKTITYDEIGNPTNDGTWSYTWQAGRQLKKMSTEGTTVSFKYDHNGLRTQKVVEQDGSPVTINYTLHGKLITDMTVDYTTWNEIIHRDNLHFFYDAQNHPAKVSFNGTIYTYLHNLQGDIVGILDDTGTLVVEYCYDAWGKLLSLTGMLANTLGKRNPFRYRGYIYDEESGLYYLRSRYYSAEKSRFLNADSYLGNVGCAFSYCDNRPLIATDRSGKKYTYDAVDAYAKPPQNPIIVFVENFRSKTGLSIPKPSERNKDTTYKYTRSKLVINKNEIVEGILYLVSEAVNGYINTKAITFPIIGAAVSAGIGAEKKWGSKLPIIPNGEYECEYECEVLHYKHVTAKVFGMEFYWERYYYHIFNDSYEVMGYLENESLLFDYNSFADVLYEAG